MPKRRNAEPAKLLAVRPDGSKLFGQWQYLPQPTHGADEDWEYVTWVEDPPAKETKP